VTEDADLIGAELRERYAGQTEPADAEMVARLLGRDDIDLDRSIAYRYATTEVHAAFADANTRNYGHESLGPVTGPDGAIYGLTILNYDADSG
jgi:hypothetical protein